MEFEGRHLPPQAARHYACRGKRYQARRRHVTLFTNSGRLTQHHDAEQMDADSYIENACTQKQNKRQRRWIGRTQQIMVARKVRNGRSRLQRKTGRAERRGGPAPYMKNSQRFAKCYSTMRVTRAQGMCNSWVRRPLNQHTSAKIGKSAQA